MSSISLPIAVHLIVCESKEKTGIGFDGIANVGSTVCLNRFSVRSKTNVWWFRVCPDLQRRGFRNHVLFFVRSFRGGLCSFYGWSVSLGKNDFGGYGSFRLVITWYPPPYIPFCFGKLCRPFCFL